MYMVLAYDCKCHNCGAHRNYEVLYSTVTKKEEDKFKNLCVCGAYLRKDDIDKRSSPSPLGEPGELEDVYSANCVDCSFRRAIKKIYHAVLEFDHGMNRYGNKGFRGVRGVTCFKLDGEVDIYRETLLDIDDIFEILGEVSKFINGGCPKGVV